MLYTITLKDEEVLDTPLYYNRFAEGVSAVVFTKQGLAEHFIEKSDDLEGHVVAELKEASAIAYLLKLQSFCVESVAINPASQKAASSMIGVNTLIERLSSLIVKELEDYLANDAETDPSASSLVCSKCGSKQKIHQGDTLPMCCGRVMLFLGLAAKKLDMLGK